MSCFWEVGAEMTWDADDDEDDDEDDENGGVGYAETNKSSSFIPCRFRTYDDNTDDDDDEEEDGIMEDVSFEMRQGSRPVCWGL